MTANRTLWWPSEQTLFIADLHAGKTQHLQRYGIAVPKGSLESDLSRLEMAIQTHQAKRVIVLGDLFHSTINTEWNTLITWVAKQSCTIELVRGNHDRFLSDANLDEAQIIAHSEPYTMSPFTLYHSPPPPSKTHQYIICGHIHPVCRVYGPGGDRLRLPCFWLHDRSLVLPAFGQFTGGYDITRLPRTIVVGCSPDGSNIIDL
jgi:DNA ligase-associated metallophosphoesterase